MVTLAVFDGEEGHLFNYESRVVPRKGEIIGKPVSLTRRHRFQVVDVEHPIGASGVVELLVIDLGEQQVSR